MNKLLNGILGKIQSGFVGHVDVDYTSGDNKSFTSSSINMSGSSIKVNGVSYSGNNVTIKNNKVIIDGKNVTPDSKNIEIQVVGNINSLMVETCDVIEVEGNVGELKSTNGNVDLNGSVNGNVSSVNGDINCGDVGGSVKTNNGDIKYRKR